MEGFILIGGKSSRMGKDKFSLILHNKTFLQTVTGTLINANVEKVSVVVSAQNNFTGNLPTVTDIFPNRGALSGIHSALVNSKSGFTIISACDYPFVTVELIEFLTNVAMSEDEFEAFAPIQADGKIQPLCAIYKTETCRQILSEMLANESENYSVRDFLNQIKTRYIQFSEIEHLPNSKHFFFNVNTPEDFILAAKLHEKNTKKTIVEIVQMTAQDVKAVLKIQQESNLSYWNKEAYKDEINRADSFLVIAKTDNQTVGFLIARIIEAENCAEIYNIGVDVDNRRKKIGEKLLKKLVKVAIENNLEKIFLEVRESNETALKFYLQNNFTIIGKRKNFYSNPTEDAILMCKEI